MNESKRTSQVLKRFRELYPDGVAWKFNDRIARSRPDTLFARRADAKFVEFKKEGNTVTPGQKLETEKLTAAGFSTYICVILDKGFDVFILEEGEPVLMETCPSIDDLCRFLS